VAVLTLIGEAMTWRSWGDFSPAIACPSLPIDTFSALWTGDFTTSRPKESGGGRAELPRSLRSAVHADALATTSLPAILPSFMCGRTAPAIRTGNWCTAMSA
jgi:hypothetical protein